MTAAMSADDSGVPSACASEMFGIVSRTGGGAVEPSTYFVTWKFTWLSLPSALVKPTAIPALHLPGPSAVMSSTPASVVGDVIETAPIVLFGAGRRRIHAPMPPFWKNW